MLYGKLLPAEALAVDGTLPKIGISGAQSSDPNDDAVCPLGPGISQSLGGADFLQATRQSDSIGAHQGSTSWIFHSFFSLLPTASPLNAETSGP